MNLMERKNTDLIKEFNTYVREHPDFAERIPNNAVVVMQMDGDEEFNEWNIKMVKGQGETDRPIVYIRIRKMKPVRSRIEELELQPQLGFQN
jgi:hypothetical protein